MVKSWIVPVLTAFFLSATAIVVAQQNQGRLRAGKDLVGQRMFLREGWFIKSSAQVSGGGEVISTEQFTHDKWYPTTVPSTVLNALMKNGVYPDMRVGLNDLLIPDASDQFNEKHGLAKHSYLPDKRNPWRDPYWYRTEFHLPDGIKGRLVWLNFNAINYRADVWLNGREVADRERMVGAFQRFRFNVTDAAKPGKNCLAVKTYPVDHPGVPDTQLKVFGPTRGHVGKEIGKDVTMNLMIGTDCMPTVRDRNIGIWQDVYADFTGSVDIRNPFVVTDLPLPATNRADLNVSAELVNATQSPQSCVLRGTIVETGLRFEQRAELAPGETKVVAFWPRPAIENPRLWWPVNYGDQNLYHLSLACEIGGQISDRESVAFGVREIAKELHEYEGAHGLRLYVNGKKVFCRGGYFQPEIIFDWDARRMETEVRYLTSANLNLVYNEYIPNLPDEFLDACDRYGLMFGNCFYGCYWMRPGSGFPEDLALLERCTIDIIKRYRNHPSMWLYMAMNEGDTREDVYTMWRRYIVELDGTRLFIPSGTFPPDRRDVPQWIKQDTPVGMTDSGASYGWQDPPTYYRFVREKRNWMFMMEGGCATLPPVDSLRRFIPNLGERRSADAPFPLDEVWAHHGANSYHRDYHFAIRRLHGEPESVADYCWKAQLVSADQHRAIFEAVNHRMWDITSGHTQWKLSSCFPSVDWQVFDWHLRPMVSLFYIRRACEPLHVQLGLLEPTVTVVNNHLEPQRGLQVRARVYDFDLKLRWEKSARTDVEANTYKDIFTIPEIGDLSPIYFVKLELRDSAGAQVSDNFYWFSTKKTKDLTDLQRLPLVRLNSTHRIERKGDDAVVRVRVENPTDNLAFFIRLAVTQGPYGEEILPVFWDDNYFSLLPGELREVAATFAAADLGGVTPTLEVGGWNVRTQYECTGVTVSKTEVRAGEEFIVTAAIANTALDGSKVELCVNGKPVASKLAWARAGKREDVAFPLKLDKKGLHTIGVSDQTIAVRVD